ncbi:hypothetical protein A2662_00495 [Candidatus Giovannonibacteria bacterium RIFCSPHIGHO2_01_FULL_45_33]|uniref:Peptidase A24A N-terminal domain-containing protein n=1 Tax=Candidatus Giovannonibacteria bacterium RIFCSPLOWO2_01_FULL_45_34 TaxID=1798351 RepID=A0A1F5WYQ3_9BACT|nr:MAG: hypothetical protein A2662_00495 [Candidatus Giovannonibacteria bacterium RIFCSPHIGHO2_01_FULL_45_33]OGF69789.1 MAG: hypothetical protein A3C73_03360 [Candidatus Giovannonibacteria bacterium RIFCSPHIGHO2_02_FULL_44_11]OGF80760.1 MAG: hypothetical protein A2930_02430 [Candidatus Giovannonibacteria bacterium RIFCSPLOWO2_01_FULL_45_34]
MEIIVLIFIFVFGAIVGSFLNVVILRKNTGESIIWDSSHCFSCGKNLKPRDLVPIFSFVFSRGRCRYCGSKISWQYPAVEALTGVLALGVYLKYLPLQYSTFDMAVWAWLMSLFYFAAFSALLLVAVYDYKRKIIDTHFIIIFSVCAVVPWIFWHQPNLSDFVSSFLIAAFFYLMWRLSDGRWMGRGDANLALPLALFLGWPLNIMMLLASFWLGGIAGIFLLLFKNSKFGLKSEIPFGPFLALGAVIVWYASSFFESFFW